VLIVTVVPRGPVRQPAVSVRASREISPAYRPAATCPTRIPGFPV